MSDELARRLETTRWVKVAIRAWSGLEREDVVLDARLNSPPFPSDLEPLRQAINELLGQKLADFRPIPRHKWEGNIKRNADVSKSSTVRDIRELCHAQR